MDMNKVIGINKLLDRFRRDVSDTFDYHFKCVNVSDFELELVFTGKSKVLRSVFNQVKRTLQKRKDMDKLKDTDSAVIERFEVPSQFYGRVLTAIHRQAKQVFKSVEEDGIKVTRHEVKKCFFTSEGEETKINILVGGIYAR